MTQNVTVRNNGAGGITLSNATADLDNVKILDHPNAPTALSISLNSGVPAISPDVAKRLWAYSDAQITFPERLVIDFLADAREIAKSKGIDFRILLANFLNTGMILISVGSVSILVSTLCRKVVTAVMVIYGCPGCKVENPFGGPAS